MFFRLLFFGGDLVRDEVYVSICICVDARSIVMRCDARLFYPFYLFCGVKVNSIRKSDNLTDATATVVSCIVLYCIGGIFRRNFDVAR